MIGHYRADGPAGGKKEIGHIDLVLVGVLGNNLAILVGQFKVGYGMVFLDMLDGGIDQFVGNVIGSINRKSTLRFEYPVEYINDDSRKDQQEDPEKLVFGEESNQIVAKIPPVEGWKKLQPLKVLK